MKEICYNLLMQSEYPYLKRWRCHKRVVTFEFPRLMGILNVTPDSFYEGSRLQGVEAAVARGVQMLAEGATILDVGGESTRPGATPITVEEELQRVLPVITALRERLPEVVLSVDTRHLEVAQAAVEVGADIYNDVEAMHFDSAKANFVATSGVGYIVMDAEGKWEPVVQQLLDAGVQHEQLVLDVGLGFQATVEETQHHLAATRTYASKPYPYLVAASRKRFIGALTNQAEASDRAAGSLGAALWAINQGANLLRVHDVRATADAMAVFLAMKGMATHV